MAWKIANRTDEYISMINYDTGAIKKIAIASDKQFDYLNKLRIDFGRKPLMGKPAAYQAKKQIDTLLAKIAKRDAQQKLV